MKDAFYDQLSASLSPAPQHDELFILGDINTVTRSDNALFPGVVGRYGSGASLNNNSERMLSFCSAHCLAALGSWFRRKPIWRWTWISNDGRTRKELDRILTNSRAMVRSYRGAEAPANTDHRLVVAVVSLAFVHHTKPKKPPKFDVQRLMTDAQVRDAYKDSLTAATGGGLG